MIIVGHFQLRIFHGISSGLWKPCSYTTVGSASHPAQVQKQGPLGQVSAQQEGKCQGHTAAIPSHLSWLFLHGSTVPGGLVGFSLSGLFCSVLKVQTTCSEAITEHSQPAHKQQPPQSAQEGNLELKKALQEKVPRRADGAARASREELLLLPIRKHMGRLSCLPPLLPMALPLGITGARLRHERFGGYTPGGQPLPCIEQGTWGRGGFGSSCA